MTKVLTLIALTLTSALTLSAQNPVNWTFSATKKSDKVFEVHMTATIQPGWHLYSQSQPDDAIASPTDFVIHNNPLVALDGKVKELGDLEKFHDEKLKVSAHQYSRKVDFVQLVKLKGNAKTNVTGNIVFTTCNDERCLPPKTVNFNIALK